MDRSAPIGILDTGVGGYTVIRELQRTLPREDLIFYGDGKNVPYGNRSGEDILHLARQCLDFLAEKGVKLAVVACNTISALIDEYQGDYPFPIFSIVQAGSDEAVRRHPGAIGVYSTVFTARSRCFERLIAQTDSKTKVFVQGSVGLAALIESGRLEGEALEAELERSLGQLAAAHPELDTLVLGCTHYPIVSGQISRLYPQFRHLIDPAEALVRKLRRCLEEDGGLNREGKGHLEVFTSGDCEKYTRMARLLGLKLSHPVSWVPAPTPLEALPSTF